MENKLTKEQIANQILEKSKEMAQKKVDEEIKNIKSASEEEVKVIQEALEIIRKGFYYKALYRDKRKWSSDFIGYIVVDEEIFMEDYLESLEGKYSYQRGVKTNNDGSFKVGENTYYHIGSLVEKFEERIASMQKNIQTAENRLTDEIKVFNEFTEKFKKLKSCILNYQKQTKKTNKD